jgi:hypothetical protein
MDKATLLIHTTKPPRPKPAASSAPNPAALRPTPRSSEG